MNPIPAIRPAVSSDATALLELLHELGYSDLDVDAHARAFALVLAHPEIRVLIAESESGRVIGLLTLSHRPQLRLGGTLVTVDELVVARDARGHGVGRALIVRAKAVAAELGAMRVELLTNRTRESYSRGFYAKNGFFEVSSAVMRLR
jgi:N-acetylglutamate synthase-like GNAT family acetyltransferase